VGSIVFSLSNVCSILPDNTIAFQVRSVTLFTIERLILFAAKAAKILSFCSGTLFGEILVSIAEFGVSIPNFLSEI
jgi:hypothetical protein